MKRFKCAACGGRGWKKAASSSAFPDPCHRCAGSGLVELSVVATASGLDRRTILRVDALERVRASSAARLLLGLERLGVVRRVSVRKLVAKQRTIEGAS